MDPHDDRDLTDLERRLAAWRPALQGLDPDAMLFAAGRVSAGRPRPIWPVLAASMSVVAAALALWANSERSERLALAYQLRSDHAGSSVASASKNMQPIAPADALPVETNPATYHALDQDPDARAALASSTYAGQADRAAAPAILRADQWDAVLNP
jgi:hypothetical protein